MTPAPGSAWLVTSAGVLVAVPLVVEPAPTGSGTPGESVPPPGEQSPAPTDGPVTEGPSPEATDPPVPEATDGTTPPPAPMPEESEPVVGPTDGPAEPEVVPTTVVPWVRPPAVTTSTLPGGLVAVALLVLVLAAAVLVVLARRGRPPAGRRPSAGVTTASMPRVAPTVRPAPTPTVTRPAAPPAAAPATGGDGISPADAHAAGVVRLLMALGEAMIDASAPVVEVRSALDRVAAAQHLPGTEVVALPTALLVSVPGSAVAHTAAASASGRSLRLDQVQGVLEVAERAGDGGLAPDEALSRLADVLHAPPPCREAARLLGYVGIAAGLALILGGGALDVVVAAVLGVGVALLRRAAGSGDAHESLVVLVGSFAVSVVVFALVRRGADLVPLASLVPPLVTFLPGALLTTAAIDLATRQMIAGAARVAAGVMQLVLLALGISAGAGLVGMPTYLLGPAGEAPLGVLAPWLGVLVFGVGAIYQHGVRRDARVWVLLVLVVAYAGQVVGGLLLGGSVSAFAGALSMTLVAMAVATRGGPPALVTFLPGFWLLVPGALGLIGVTSFLGNEVTEALATVVTTATTMVSISLGVLAGTVLGGTVLSRRSPVAS